MATTDDSDDAARLIAERDELRAEVEQLQTKLSTGGRWRRTVVGLFVVLACILWTVAVPAVWARRNFLDTDRFVDRVAPVIDDPAVQEALTLRLTEQIMLLINPRELFEQALPERGQLLAVPLTSAVEGFVRDRVEIFVDSDAFARLWEGSARIAHETAVRVLRDEGDVLTTGDGRVTLNLLPVINAVLSDITTLSPEILGRTVELPEVTVDDVPDAVIARLEEQLGVDLGDEFGQFTVYDEGKLEAAQQGIKLFDRAVVAILVLAVVFAALAIWGTRRRRRTIFQLAAGVAIGMVLLRRIVFRFDDDLVALPPTPQGREAARVVADAFLDPLTTFAAWAFAVAGLVAAIAFVTGNYPRAVSLRHRAAAIWTQAVSTTGERARDEATVAWTRQHRDLLLTAGVVVGLAILWATDLSWLGLLLLVVLVAAYEVAVYRIGAPAEQPEPAEQPQLPDLPKQV